MSVKIRLKRMGAKKKPFYRIVVADSRSPRDGKFIEEIGYYNPLTNPAEIKVDGEKALQWIKNGAQTTDTVRSLLVKAGVLEKATSKASKAAAPKAQEPAQEPVEEAPAEEVTEEAEAPAEEPAAEEAGE